MSTRIATVLPLRGIRILEVAGWVMVPATTAILQQWGAEVVKVEEPEYGDPLRGLKTGSSKKRHKNYQFHSVNRGKRSISLDLKKPEGLEVLHELVRSSDVFVTSFLPPVRARLRIEVDDLRAVHPQLVYARGSAVGPRGGERDRGGFDFATYWSRAGLADNYQPPDLEYPLPQLPAFGDLATSGILAGGIAAALLQRALTGVASVVDASLLATGCWVQSGEMAAAANGEPPSALSVKKTRHDAPNPLSNIYRTSDGRFLSLVMLQGDRGWPSLCRAVGRPDLLDDERFATTPARTENRLACIAALDRVFAQRPLAEWRSILRDLDGVWEPVQSMAEVIADPQVVANGYILDTGADAESPVPERLVATPIQFDEQPAVATRAPEHGEHTEDVLLGLGYGWDRIIELKDRKVIV